MDNLSRRYPDASRDVIMGMAILMVKNIKLSEELKERDIRLGRRVNIAEEKDKQVIDLIKILESHKNPSSN